MLFDCAPTRSSPLPYNARVHAIPDILEDLRQGKMIVLVDDEQRENEGDLVCAAEFTTPTVVNFMLREGRGLLCVALTGQRCDELELSPQAPVNTTQRGTAFTVSIDAHERFGVSTGVSAADRSATIGVTIDPATRPQDLARPGHVHPLRARDGGCLVRAGQTEGSVDLCKLAGLKPAAAIIEIMNDDGSMARIDDLRALCKKHEIKMCSVADVIEYRLAREKLIHRIATAPFESAFGQFNLVAYDSVVDSMPHVALTCGDVGKLDECGEPMEIHEPVLVRMHSQNLLGDVFGDIAQPSGETLRRAMQAIQAEGQGALVYLRHERMGAGLLRRLQTMRRDGEDPAVEQDRHTIGSSQTAPGMRPPTNTADYGIGSQILRDLGVRKIRLLTNHSFQPKALSGFGLEIVEFVPVKP